MPFAHDEDCADRTFFGEPHDHAHTGGPCGCPCHAPSARRCTVCPAPHTWDAVTGADGPDDAGAPEKMCPGAVNRAIETSAVTGWLNERERARLRGVEMLEKCFAFVGGEEAAMEYEWEIMHDHPTLKGPVPRCKAKGATT